MSFFEEGRFDRRAGVYRQENPYPENTAMYVDWDDGWMEEDDDIRSVDEFFKQS